MPAQQGRPRRAPAATHGDAHREGLRDGLVIVNYGTRLLVEDDQGRLLRCSARRGLGQVVCGDVVGWRPADSDEGVVERVAPRHSVLLRADSGNRQRPLAANIDQVVIEAAREPALDCFLIDKYTVAAELAHTDALIVINKSDLLQPQQRREIAALLADYTDLGYEVLFTSALCNTGIEAFAARMAGRTSILVGQSGVGKSSLVGRLLPERDITIGRLSGASGLGRHTTTTTTLYHLPGGGNLIDSPGVRDFRLGKVTPARLGSGLREFRALSGQCRFNDCRHVSEPGCAVLAALAAGRISARRMESYRRLLPGG